MPPDRPTVAPGRRVVAKARIALAVAALLAVPVACGGDEASSGRLDVIASVYPLQWVAEQVGGDHVAVSGLTGAGAEPHDLELTPKQVAGLADTDLVVFLGGFQPAVDTAVADVAEGHAFDAADHTDLLPVTGPAGQTDPDGALDPHFWLDPTRLAEVADALATRLGELDADRAEAYAANADRLARDLATLDEDLAEGLASCDRTELVTSHAAFGYLADRYGLEEVGITGVSADQEPSPADLARLADLVEDLGVTTVYVEVLASPAVAEALAAEAGVDTAVLDPLEGISDRSAGRDYLEVMRANLATLRQGQGCR